MSSHSLRRVEPTDPDYCQRAEAEKRFWREMHPLGLEAVEQTHSEGPVDRYINQRFTGDPELRWEQSLCQHGQFRRGLALGTGSLHAEARILETNPSLHLTFVDLDEGPLARRRQTLGERFPGRVDTRAGDLNFLKIEPDSYDLIVSSSTIHHVLNLEYLADQINAGLTPQGRFFLQDYVGEPRFGFSSEKQRIYEILFNRDVARQGRPAPGLLWLDESDLSPFCGVRSDEILSVLRLHLDQLWVRTAATLITPMMRSRPASEPTNSPWSGDSWVRKSWTKLAAGALHRIVVGRSPSKQGFLSQQFLDELVLVGDATSDAGLLEPCLAFAAYGKRPAAR